MDSDPVRGSSGPGRCWTLTHAGEATPEVLSALCWSVWSDGVELGGRTALCDLGVLDWGGVRRPDSPDSALTGSFFGRHAVNVDVVRSLFGAVPGVTPDDVERDLLGTVRPDAPAVPVGARRLVVAVKAPRVIRQHRNRPRTLHDAQLKWWREHIFDAAVDDPLGLLADSALRFRMVMRAQVHVWLLLLASRSSVTAAATEAGRPDLLGTLLAGYGEVPSTSLAADLWALGRGDVSLGDFLSRHGFHGPHAGNPVGRSWREDPSGAQAVASATAARPDEQLPRAREAHAVARRLAAEGELLAAVPFQKRRAVRRELDRLGDHTRSLGLTEVGLLTAIDGCRRAVRLHGEALVESGTLKSADEAFHFTKEELFSGLPSDARDIAESRRERREDHRPRGVDAVFHGMPEPVAPASVAEVLRGVPGSPGVVEGRVRNASALDGTADLQDGDILVFRSGGASWAPQLSLAAGVAVDLGSPTSTTAIVAREIGIPGVVGTHVGSRVLSDGDVVRLDGDAGTVARVE